MSATVLHPPGDALSEQIELFHRLVLL